MNQWLKAALPAAILLSTNLAHAEGDFKRWAVSAGWLHVMPQGNANSTNISTAVEEGGNYGVSKLRTSDVVNHSTNLDDYRKGLAGIAVNSIENAYKKDPNSYVSNTYAKDLHADTYGISNWTNNAGLEADDVDTLGFTLSYFANENVSLELIGGVPPKVDIQGKGQIVASVRAESNSSALLPSFVNGLTLEKDILVTDLAGHGKIAEVTAWTPAFTAKYHFGKPGVNKFRPFVGAGVVYGHFNKLKLNGGVEQDLINAGHMIQNVLDNKSGIALENSGSSSANPVVKVKTDDAFAPVVTAGFSYDLTDRWFTTASLTYMPNFYNTATITVTDSNTGNQLIKASTKVDLDPLITYVGVGYRF
ncbi:OmpW family outer membrane protein [Acinetobacter gerneri]|uniref:OmpW family outer membrane protein n=1 Tax=Acinetobacter gerneri TaxID=202952 RepID=A0AAW8JIS8_9GAMM|nr:OmpW family outer membrane protein [Acinetobacter gerneri]MDQ9010001.1 OmpW family outer membrane protein [Acinetobacter gerneri]MDQ9014077.1 OmpW family outer membrane protein [Acinetobacter gerneri]MDQ9025357.1 OmpW family outer membrane protein [Acinetobacter gerneri]MDQ9052636.1 OmpW family outer membrane protein [Acinetobacter gerneri]MDQ9060071.1 OmpW family outer membrane protein [Acinetobacter gerneri]